MALWPLLQNAQLKVESECKPVKADERLGDGGMRYSLPAYHDSQARAEEWEFLKQMPVK